MRKADDLNEKDAPKKVAPKKTHRVLYSVGMMTGGHGKDPDATPVQISRVEQWENTVEYGEREPSGELNIQFLDAINVIKGGWTLDWLQERLGIENEHEVLEALFSPDDSGFADPRYDNPMDIMIDRLKGKYTAPRTGVKSMKQMLK